MELIQCTRQPGNLRITKKACALQYRHARERLSKRGKVIYSMGVYSSLEVCRECPKGRYFFEELGGKRRRKRHHHISDKRNSFA